MNRRMLLGAFVLVAATTHAAPIDASLILPAPTLLPGVPFDMVVVLKNTSQEPASVGLIARLVVTLPNGHELTPAGHAVLSPNSQSDPQSAIELAPGEERRFAVAAFELANWTSNGEYTGPGTYAVALDLDAGRHHPGNWVGVLRTRGAQLVRTVSPGEDAELWKRMQAASDGVWSDDGFVRLKSGIALAHEILAIHPGSAYYPYALLARPPYRNRRATPDDLRLVRDAADRFASSPVHEHLLVALATVAADIATGAWWRHDALARAQYNALSAKYCQDALAKVTNPALLDTATHLLDRVRVADGVKAAQ